MKPCIRRILSLLLLLCSVLSLSSCKLPLLEQTTVGELTFSLYGNGRIERIAVHRGEEHIGTYTERGMSRDMLAALDDDSYGLILTELNFDGMPDMCIKNAKGSAGVRYAVYLWDAAQDGYVYHEALSALQGMGMLATEQAITAREFEHIIDPATGDTPEMYIEREAFVIYRWIDGVLTEVHRKEKTYYEENDIYCYAVYERDVNGETVTVRESWISPEDMANGADCPMDETGYGSYVAPSGLIP